MALSFESALAQIKTVKPYVDPNKKIVTFSMLQSFANCHRQAYWRYDKGLKKCGEDNKTLQLGSMVHAGIEGWHTSFDMANVNTSIEKEYVKYPHDDTSINLILHTKAMLNGYVNCYGNEQDESQTLSCEIPFCVPINDKYQIAGKLDGLWWNKYERSIYLDENKTAAEISGNYLAKLWDDLQLQIYLVFGEEQFNIPITGIVYNIIEKARLQRKQGESDEEWNLRLLEAKRPSACKRKMPEDDCDYFNRLQDFYYDPLHYHREVLYFDNAKRQELKEEIADMLYEYDHCSAEGRMWKNRARCYDYYRECPYKPLCNQSDDLELLIDSLYEFKKPHEELGLL